MTAKQKIKIINVLSGPNFPSVYVQFLDSNKELDYGTVVYCCERVETFFQQYDYLSTDLNTLNDLNHAIETALSQRSKLLGIRTVNRQVEATIEDWKGVVTTERYTPSSSVTKLFQTLGKEDHVTIIQAIRDIQKETQK